MTAISLTGAVKSSIARLWERLPYRWRVVNVDFRVWTRRLADFEAMSGEAARAEQWRSFEYLVRLAWDRTAFYRERWGAAGFHPDQLRGPDDLHRIPVLTKDDVRRDAARMIVDGRPPDSVWKMVTSGTTGTPLTLYTDRRSSLREWASICWQWARVGYAPGDGRVELRGLVEGDAPVLAIPSERALRVNIHALNATSLPAVIEAIARSGYRFLHGYPSAIEKLCELLETSGSTRSVPAPQGILLSSEVVYDRQKERIRAAFPESRLFAHYGQAERVALAGWIPAREAYHFLPAHGLVERDPETGEIIATGFGNEVMPLVRYRLSDVADGFDPGPSREAPNLFPVAERIDGRLEDYLYKPDGERVPPAIVTFPFKEGRTFASCRLVQHDWDAIEIVIEARAPEAEVRAEFEGVVTKLRMLFGPRTRFTLTLVGEIPRGASGKFRWLENRIANARQRA